MVRNLIRAGAACVLAALVFPASLVRADEIDPLLAKDAAELMKVFRSRGYKNVGVLKFEVQRGGPAGPVSMSNGTLNSMMATRLENALILAPSGDEKNAIGIVRGASEAAAKADKNAGYHSKTAREKLFQHTYPLAWGNKTVKVDAFLTGRITISPDYKKSTVRIDLFDKSEPGKVFTGAASFDAPVDRTLIVDLGQPFAISKATIAKRALNPNLALGTDSSPTAVAANAEDLTFEDVAKSAEKADENRNKSARPYPLVPAPMPVQPFPAPMPLPTQEEPNLEPSPVRPVTNKSNNSKVQPVAMQAQRPSFSQAKAELDAVLQFDVYYNGQLVNWTADNRLPTPNANDRIEFKVRAKSDKIGMVLRVNGVNTADYDRTPKDIKDYSMWVLNPGMEYGIAGFYTNDNKVLPFVSVLREEVDRSELGDERKIGKIDIDIFREYAPGNGGPELAARGLKTDLRAPVTGESAAKVRGQIRQLASRSVKGVVKRGIIVGGQEEDANVQTTQFQGLLAIHFPVTYYDPNETQPGFILPENNP